MRSEGLWFESKVCGSEAVGGRSETVGEPSEARFMVRRRLAGVRKRRFVLRKSLAMLRKRLAGVRKGRFTVRKPLAGMGKPLVGLGMAVGGC